MILSDDDRRRRDQNRRREARLMIQDTLGVIGLVIFCALALYGIPLLAGGV